MLSHTSKHAVLSAWNSLFLLLPGWLNPTHSSVSSHHSLFCKTFPDGSEQVPSFYYTLLGSSVFRLQVQKRVNHTPQFITHLSSLPGQDSSLVLFVSIPNFHSHYLPYCEHTPQVTYTHAFLKNAYPCKIS